MSDTTEKNEIRLLYKVRNTVLTTLKDRGYDIPSGSSNMSPEDFKSLYEQNRHHLYFPNMLPVNLKEEYKKGGGVLVYFEPSDKFDKHILKSHMIQLNKEYPNLDKLFFVLKTYGIEKKQKLNTFVRLELSEHPNVEVLENIYPFDFMKNIMVPECYLLSSEEKEAVIKMMDTPLHNFPKFESTDPIPTRFGAKVGDMFHIKRYGGLELSYRVVVKPGSG
jgi:DNA-directed RNA polymerase subunit H (RpoH/RPB5)